MHLPCFVYAIFCHINNVLQFGCVVSHLALDESLLCLIVYYNSISESFAINILKSKMMTQVLLNLKVLEG